jgi:hypothetical protein
MKKYETKEEAKKAIYLSIKKWRDEHPEKIKKYNSEYYKRKKLVNKV